MQNTLLKVNIGLITYIDSVYAGTVYYSSILFIFDSL